MLDVVNLAPKGLLGWVAVAARVVTPQPARAAGGWSTGRRDEVVITSDVAQPAQVDGDLIGEARELRIRVDAGALVVRVPGRVERGAG